MTEVLASKDRRFGQEEPAKETLDLARRLAETSAGFLVIDLLYVLPLVEYDGRALGVPSPYTFPFLQSGPPKARF